MNLVFISFSLDLMKKFSIGSWPGELPSPAQNTGRLLAPSFNLFLACSSCARRRPPHQAGDGHDRLFKVAGATDAFTTTTLLSLVGARGAQECVEGGQCGDQHQWKCQEEEEEGEGGGDHGPAHNGL